MREQLLNKPVNVYNYSGSYIGYYFRLYVYLNNQDIPGNTSDITITLYGKANTSTGGGYSGFSTPTAKVRIGNEDKNSRSGVNIPTSGAEVSMATWRGNVEHNDDGSLSISVSGIYAPNTTSYNYLPQATTISSTITLPTIARASTVTVPATLISSSSGNVTATITSKADYWHKWRRYIVGTTVPAWNTKGEINNTTATVTVSYSDILNAMPNDWQGKLHIDVATYSSSSYSTQIGSTQYAEADVTINKNYIKPSFSIGTITYNSNPSGAPNYIIAGYSKASVAITNITQGVGATTSKYIQVDFYKGSSRLLTSLSTITGSSTTVVSGIMPSSTETYQIKAKVTVTDSRTAYTTAESSEANVYGYDKPTLTFTAYRVASSGSTTYDGAGGYVYLSVTGTVNGLASQGNSIQTWTCKQDSSSGTAITLDNSTHRAWVTLATTRSKTFYGRVTDKVSTSSNTITIPVAMYPLDLYDNGSGTVGAGVGTIAKSGWFTSGLKNEFTQDTILRNHYANYVANTLSSSDGYVILATFTVTSTYADAPIYLRLSKRGYASWYVCIRFTNANGTDPTLNYFKTDNHTTYLYKSATSKWQLIIPYSGYDAPAITDIQLSYYEANRVTVDYTMTYLSALPNGSVEATRDLYLPISSSNTADGEYKFLNSSYAPTIADTAPGIGCANKGSRYLINELLTDGIIAPPTAYTEHSMNTTASTIRFYKYTGYSGGQWTGLTKTAYIDTSGTYHPQVSRTDTYMLAGLCGVAISATQLRVQIPVPSGYSSFTVALVSGQTTANLDYNGTDASFTFSAVSTLDQNPASVSVTLTTSGLTAYRVYGFRNGRLSITLS